MHYSRYKAHGSPLAPGRRAQSDACSMDECGARPLAKDLCRRHYYQRARGATARPEATPRPQRKPRAKRSVQCAVSECNQQRTARGWCGMHYQRWRRFGDPEFHPPAPARICTIEGCSKVPNARGLCPAHYYRWSTYGDPLVGRQKPRRTLTERLPFPPRICQTCGDRFEPGMSAARKYCGKTCKPSGRIAGSVNKRPWVEKLGNEDGWECWLCNEPVDPGLYWPAPFAGSVDHVTPVSHRGTDERSNLRLAHLRCNTRRKDKIVEG